MCACCGEMVDTSDTAQGEWRECCQCGGSIHTDCDFEHRLRTVYGPRERGLDPGDFDIHDACVAFFCSRECCDANATMYMLSR